MAGKYQLGTQSPGRNSLQALARPDRLTDACGRTRRLRAKRDLYEM
jgi:hypothetical protein